MAKTKRNNNNKKITDCQMNKCKHERAYSKPNHIDTSQNRTKNARVCACVCVRAIAGVYV